MNSIQKKIILVDGQDRPLGQADQVEAHTGDGLLHRAVSAVLYRHHNTGLQVLLQRRSQKKHLWPGYWSNTICTHPYMGETYVQSALRRLREELGISILENQLQPVFRFIYRDRYDTGFSEYELDTVIIGQYEGEIVPNEDEVMEVKWVDVNQVRSDMQTNPSLYTPYSKHIFSHKEFWSFMENI